MAYLPALDADTGRLMQFKLNCHKQPKQKTESSHADGDECSKRHGNLTFVATTWPQ